MADLSSKDERLIRGLARWHRWRRWAGLFLLLMGLGAAGAATCFVYDLRSKALAGFAELEHVRNPTTQQVDKVMSEAEFHAGLLLGVILAFGYVSGIWMVGEGLMTLFVRQRKNRLLLQAYGKSLRRPAENEG